MTAAASTSDHADVDSACSRLIIDFADGMDRRDYPRVLQLFAEDAVLDRAGVVMRGIDEIRGFLEKRPEHVVTRHLCTNIRVRPQGDDEANGTCYLQFFQSANEEGQQLPVKASATAVAEYIVGFVRQHGNWRIREFRIHPVFQG